MITGYNTDVRHQEVVFHVQTEDKGAANPFIESLVYVGGQVLATKRASYADLLAGGQDEKSIVAFMDHQHRTMIAAIRHGKFDDRLGSLVSARPTGNVPHAGPVPTPEGMPAGGARLTPERIPLPPLPAMPPPAAAPPPPSPAAAAAPPARVAPAAEPIAEPTVMSSPLPAAMSGVRAAERSLDQVILEYLTSEADQEQLLLALDGEQSLAPGGPGGVTLRASSSKSGQPIVGAQVVVKMISTVAEPRLLATGRTDAAGALRLLFEIPRLERGTAALIISAVSPIGRAELKQLL